MSERKGAPFSLLITFTVFVLLLIINILSNTLSEKTLIGNLLICIFAFITIYYSYKKGYIDGYNEASREKFNSYLDGLEAGLRIHKTEEISDEESWPE